MTLKTRLLILATLSSCLLVAALALGVYMLRDLKSNAAAMLLAAKDAADTAVAIEAAQIGLKSQVQEWKDLLLRGNDPQNYDKYLAQFGDKEGEVKANLQKAMVLMQKQRIATEEVESLLQAHAALDGRYREALKSYDKADPMSGQKVDKLVKGMDRPAAQAMNKLVKQIEVRFEKESTDAYARADADYQHTRNLFLMLGALGVLTLLVIFISIIRRLLSQLGGDPAYAVEVSRRIARGDLTTAIATRPGDTGSLLAAMKAMQEQLRLIVADIQTLVDQAGSGDFSGRIDTTSKHGFGLEISTALNALVHTTDEGLTDITRVSQALSAGDLSLTISRRYQGQFGLTIGAINTTVFQLREVIHDVRKLVDSAARGDFSYTINLDNKRGFGSDISISLNRLVETTHEGLSDITRISQALSAGDLSLTIDKHYQGQFGQTVEAINTTVHQLKAVIDDVRRIVDAAAQGDFNHHIAVADRQGYARTLSALLNRLNSTAEAALRDILQMTQALADGDLGSSIGSQHPGMFGDTARGIGITVIRLREVVGQIQQAATAINGAAGDIAYGTADLSKRTEEQASSLEETAASMQQQTATVAQTANNAAQANQQARHSADLATLAGDSVKRVASVMQSIQADSSKMADFVTIIDGIAFQTNILALNAAVEAARAGDHGRGFAVVATEVRALSHRSAAAAKEIKTLIDNSITKIGTGGGLIAEAGAKVDEVSQSFQAVLRLVSDIAIASQEQAAGIEQVTMAIGQLDDVTQQNAALVEEAAAATDSLQDQANNLVQAVGVFRLPEQAPGLAGAARRLSLPSSAGRHL